MVDTADIFAKLGSGARFYKIKLAQDSNFLKATKSHENPINKDKLKELDFFGSSESHSSSEPHAGMVVKLGKEPRKKSTPDSQKMMENESSTHSEQMANGKTFTAEKREQLRQEKVNCLRNEHQIHVLGTDVPDPLTSFTDLTNRFQCSQYIVRTLLESGYESPTPVQMQTLPLMLNHRDILVCAPTGSGKTLAFIVPILHCLKKPMKVGFRALVVAPTRELANQIYREFGRINVEKGFRIHVLTKSKALSGNFSNKESGTYDILITTPNRLVHLLQQDPPQIQLNSVEWLVLDEGDKLFEDGKDGFREQIATIINACDNDNITRTLFSATLANQVEDWCRLHLNNFVRVTVGARNAATESVNQEMVFVGQESGKLIALRDLFRKGFVAPILVFVQSKERGKELFNELIYDGINVDVIHSDRTQAQRDNVVKCFRTGKVWVLIATELMGRGIDFKGVNLVVNYDFPPSAISYIHRIGRTGRAGRSGSAVTFFTEDDITSLKSIANVMQASGCNISPWMMKLKKPSRSTKRILAKSPLKRDSIVSMSKFPIKESHRKRKLLEASKKRNGGKVSRISSKRS